MRRCAVMTRHQKNKQDVHKKIYSTFKSLYNQYAAYIDEKRALRMQKLTLFPPKNQLLQLNRTILGQRIASASLPNLECIVPAYLPWQSVQKGVPDTGRPASLHLMHSPRLLASFLTPSSHSEHKLLTGAQSQPARRGMEAQYNP